MAFIIKTNASQGTDVLIADLGYIIPNSGGSVTLTEAEEIERAIRSEDLRTLVTDDAFTGSSTLVMNDGSSDIDDADVLNWLDTFQLPAGDQNYGVVKTNGSGQIDTNVAFDGTATVTNLALGNDLDANSNKITGLAAGVGSTDAVTKGQLDAATAGGKVWKEVLLDCDSQLLDGASGGVRSATAFFLQEQPTANDTLTLAHTTLTDETFTFVSSESVAFDVGIGVDVDATLQALVDAINADSAGWGAALVTTLQSINDGTGSVTAGLVVVIYELAANDTGDSRAYGSFATGVPSYVNFNGETDYDLSTVSALPSSDPAQREFGIGRAYADLVTNETHPCRTDDAVKTWNSDQEQWESTGANGIQAGSGLIKTGDVLDVDWGETGDIAGLGSATAAGVLEEAARADHVHTHGDRGGDGSTSQHDADQVDVEGTLSRIGAPGDAETVLGQIDTNFGDAKYVGKVLQYGHTTKVPSSGTLHLMGAGELLGSQVGKRMVRSGVVSSLSMQVPNGEADGSNAFKLSVEKSTDDGATWSEAASMAFPTSTTGAHTTSPTAGAGGNSYAAGTLLRVLVVRTSGSGASNFKAVDAHVELNEG